MEDDLWESDPLDRGQAGKIARGEESTSLPGGTVTFLFTDIEGSTKLLEHLREQYAQLLAEHHQLMRETFQRWHGHEVDTEGDAFFIVFTRATDAIACAIEAQQSLNAHAWPKGVNVRVRMGLHTGEPLVAHTGYVGMDVHRAARITHVGYGGQVLLSQTTRDLVCLSLPTGSRLRDLGAHMLKDMRYPQEIYQLEIPGLPSDFPPLKSLDKLEKEEEPPSPGESPYMGLQYFDEEDAEWFFGRQAVIERLVKEVCSNHFLAVIGASGSGKSSVVRAGLVPTMKIRTQPEWLVKVTTPTSHPLEALSICLTSESESVTATATLIDDMQSNPRSLHLYCLKRLVNRKNAQFLLVVDQFEELFTLCRSEEERLAFIHNLLYAVDISDGVLNAVITLRADFYERLAQYVELREVVSTHQIYIGAMNASELRAAIEEPARRGGWEFSPGLVDLILSDLGVGANRQPEPGALPLLSHALLETWKRRRGNLLNLKAYTEAGGVSGAIAKTAESVFYRELTPDQQVIAKSIFLRLTELGEGTQDTRRRISIHELIPPGPAIETEQIQTVLVKLADARLIITGEETVEVAHEALIREWPTLGEWLAADREGLRLHRHLTEAAQEWELLECDPGALYRGTRLNQALEWAIANPRELNAQEQAFLEASRSATENELREREEQRQRELEAAQKLAETERKRAEEGIKSARRLKRRAILLGVFGVLAVILAVFALFAWQRSAAQAALNQSLNLAGSAKALNIAGQRDLALLLAKESVNTKQPPSEALSALRTIATDFGTRTVLSGHSQAVMAVAISPDGKTALSGSCANLDSQGSCLEGELILWDLEGMQEKKRWSAHSDWVTAVAYSLDGQILITGSGDGSLLLWNLTGKQIGQLVGSTGRISDLALVLGSGYLLSGSADGSLILWDLQSEKAVRNFNKASSPITALAVASGSSTAATAHQDGGLIVWDLENPAYLRRFEGSSVSIQSVAILPDASQVIFTVGTPPEMFLRIVDGKTGNQIADKHFVCNPGDVALSPDATTVLMGCVSFIFQIDIPNLNIIDTSFDTQDPVNALAISQDGCRALSASQDGTLRLWNLGAPRNIQSINFNVDQLTAFAVSPDGKYLLLSDALKDGSDQPALWDIQKREIVRSYAGLDGFVFPGAVAISPDSRFVAAAGTQLDNATPVVKIWDMESGKLHCDLKSLTEIGRAVAFSPDSAYLLAGTQVLGGYSGHLILYDANTCEQVRQFDTDEEVTSISFTRDGKQALTGAAQLGRAVLWDVATGKEIKRFSYARSGPVMAVAFGPDDSTVMGSGMGELNLWDMNTGNLLRKYTGIILAPMSVSISPDGKYVLSGDMNGDVILWNFSTGEELGRENLKTMVFSVAFSPDGQTAFAASIDGKLIEWPSAEQSLPELLEWVNENRYVRELTCQEKIQYYIDDPSCRQ
jgi:WD40 repeat protein/class 3 adenylate cyclase